MRNTAINLLVLTICFSFLPSCGKKKDQNQAVFSKKVSIDEYFMNIDKNKDGKIDFKEFSGNNRIMNGVDEKVELDSERAAFNLYDVNHDGFITRDELRDRGWK